MIITDIFLQILRVGILLILSLYTIFALIIVRQVDFMNDTLMTPVSGVVKYASFINVIMSVWLIILTFSILR